MNRVAIMGMKLSGMDTMYSMTLNWNRCDALIETLPDMMFQWIEFSLSDKVNLKNAPII